MASPKGQWVLVQFEYDCEHTYEHILTVIVSQDVFEFIKARDDLEVSVCVGQGNDSDSCPVSLQKYHVLSNPDPELIDFINSSGYAPDFLESLRIKYRHH